MFIGYNSIYYLICDPCASNGKLRPGIYEFGCTGMGQNGFKRGPKSDQRVTRDQARVTRGSIGGYQGVIDILSFDLRLY